MPKKTIWVAFAITIVLSIYGLVSAIKPINELVEGFETERFDSLEVRLFFTWKNDSYFVKDPSTMSKMMEIIGESKVIPIPIDLQSSDAHHKSNYMISFNHKALEKNPSLFIEIRNGKNVMINGKRYTIIGESRLRELFALTILAQDPGTIDPYYFDLIQEN